jgi:excisionase family DNA binding protein
MIDKQTYSVAEVAEILGVGKTLIYSEIANGKLPAIRLGRRRLIVPRWAVEDLLRRPANEPNTLKGAQTQLFM